MRDLQLPGRSPVLASRGMCATSHPLASRVAIETLMRGGNAVDAAIAGAVLLGLCEPQMTGLGGDCFVLLKPAGSEDVIALNGSGKAPAGASAQSLRDRGLTAVPLYSADAVTVPGAVDAFCKLSSDHGKLGIADTLGPVIPYFRDGVPVAPRVAFDWAEAEETPQGRARELFLPWGKAPKMGTHFALPDQANALEAIAKNGRAGFYEGSVAEDMVNSLRALGGQHTLNDFAATSADYTAPVSGMHNGLELVEHPPNGMGATAILMNAILQNLSYMVVMIHLIGNY